jgi:uncharacterized protein (UPF0248 family)
MEQVEKARIQIANKGDALKMITQKVAEFGIPFTELAKRTEIPYHRVRRTLSGEGLMWADDFIKYCQALKIEIN